MTCVKAKTSIVMKNTKKEDTQDERERNKITNGICVDFTKTTKKERQKVSQDHYPIANYKKLTSYILN